MSGSITYTNTVIADPVPTMILGKDPKRTELDIYNLSQLEFIYIGLGNENKIFRETEMLPLAPGEAYSSSSPPITAVYIMAHEPTSVVVSASSQAPGYVGGTLSG